MNVKNTFLKTIIAVSLILVLLFALSACSSSKEEEVTETTTTTTTIAVLELPISSEDVYGKNYKNLVDMFGAEGFTNIVLDPIDDLIFGWLTKDGDVEEVAINGNTSFAKGDEARASDKIVIRYHTFPETTTGSETTKKTTTTTAKKATTTKTTATIRTVVPSGATVKMENGKWGLYQGTTLVSDFTGIAENEYGKWYIQNGYVDFEKNGTVTYNRKKYQVAEGRATEITTTTKKKTITDVPNGAEVKMVNGTWGLYQGTTLVDNFTGVATNNYGKWYIRNGLVDFGKNGTVNYKGKKYQVNEGKATEVTTTTKATTSYSQYNAQRRAKSYLRTGSFSRDGLIEQLEFEGFSKADATWGADHADANWNEEAAESAKGYMSWAGFSRRELIEQLRYEGFTSGQAEYGAKAVGY